MKDTKGNIEPLLEKNTLDNKPSVDENSYFIDHESTTALPFLTSGSELDYLYQMLRRTIGGQINSLTSRNYYFRGTESNKKMYK